MLKAIREGKIDQIQSLIDDGFPLESILTGEMTALGEAVNVGDPSIISLLLSHGAKAQSGGHWVRDPFFLAINSGKTTIVRLLLAHGANVNHFIQGGGDSPLHVAIRHEDAETTRVLLEWNANVNIKGSQSPLLAAVKRQSLNIVRLLLEHDADVDSEDKTGANSLDIAIRKRDLPIFKMLLLLRQGASPNSEVLHGDILDLAIAAGDVDVANILSEDGTKFSSAKARSAYIAMSGKLRQNRLCWPSKSISEAWKAP
jgi:ankyrin repeat protein